MTNLKKRIDKIETSLNGGMFVTLEDLVAGTNDPSLPGDPRRLPPELERFFSRIAGEKQDVRNESRNLKGK
jgi:hypothetical protein